MSQYFFGTSAAVKQYHNEPGTVPVSAIFGEPGRQVRISSLGLIEIQSALAMKIRSGILVRRAAVRQHAFYHRLRTLDALQLAVAGDLKSQELLDQFVVADQALAIVATAEGLDVLNPETS